MLSDANAKSIIYQRQNQDPTLNYNRRSMPGNIAQNSPSLNESVGWKTSSSGTNQTPSINPMENRGNDYWQKTPQFQPQFQQQNVLQTTAMFHELENKLDKVRYFCEQIKAITVDPSTVLEWNAERYNSLTSLATSLRGSVENLSKTPINPQYTPQSVPPSQQNQFQSQPIPNQPSIPPQSQPPNRNPNDFTNPHFRGNYPIVQNQNYNDYYQQSPQLMNDMVTDNPSNTNTSNGNNSNPNNNSNNGKYQPSNGMPQSANVSANLQRDPPPDTIDPKNAQTMMASFPPNKSYEVVWAQPDQKQRRPRKRKIKDDDS